MSASPDPRTGGRREPIRAEIVLATGSIATFALLAHHGLPWILFGAIGLLLAGTIIGRQLARWPQPTSQLGLEKFDRVAFLCGVLGAGIGTGAGIWYRASKGLSMGPVAPGGAFVVVACVIGASEELVYRGWLQGAVRQMGWPAAVLIAATSHTAYKTALVLWPPVPLPIDYLTLVIGTMVGGSLLGVLREFSGSLWPAVAGHVAFDYIVYRAFGQAPWWVWS